MCDALHASGGKLTPALGGTPCRSLERIRRTVGEYNFAGQYQQTPAPLRGGLVKAEWFKRYGRDERPESFERIDAGAAGGLSLSGRSSAAADRMSTISAPQSPA